MFALHSRVIIVRWSLCSFILLTYFLRLDALAQRATALQIHFRNALAAYMVGGTVSDDYNQNGAQDTREPGINGIIVTAYNSAGTSVRTATTATSGNTLGQYTLSIPNGTGPVRIQFTNYGATSSSTQLVGYQPSNHAGGTPVSFVDGTQATNTVNFGLEHPEEYC